MSKKMNLVKNTIMPHHKQKLLSSVKELNSFVFSLLKFLKIFKRTEIKEIKIKILWLQITFLFIPKRLKSYYQ